ARTPPSAARRARPGSGASSLLEPREALADLVAPHGTLQLGVGIEQALQQLGLGRRGHALDAELGLLEHAGLHRLVFVGAEEVDAGLVDAHRGGAATLAREVVLVLAAQEARAVQARQPVRAGRQVGVVEHAVLHAHAPVRLVAGRRDLHELGAVHLGRRVAHVDIAEHQRVAWIVDLAAGAATRAARGDGEDSGQNYDPESIFHSYPPFEIEG